MRGNLRYAGFPEFIKVLVDMGLLSDATQSNLSPSDGSPLTWATLTASLLGSTSNSEAGLLAALDKKTSIPASEKARIVKGLRWIGLFSNEQVTKRGTPLDSLCATLEAKMKYGPGERDMVFLQHVFDIEWADGRTEMRTSTLVDYGDPKGYSSMAKLVGVPCGVATIMVLDGRIAKTGIQAPLNRAMNEPIMKELKEKYGIYLTEKTV
jgi:saccharopine dehydrogenase (NADP+, L-glutamate forming)